MLRYPVLALGSRLIFFPFGHFCPPDKDLILTGPEASRRPHRGRTEALLSSCCLRRPFCGCEPIMHTADNSHNNGTTDNFTTVSHRAVHEFHETCHSVTFYSWKNSFSDISRKCILPNKVGAVTDCTDCNGQFTPKMKANAKPRLLSSLVWIDSG